MARKTTKTPPKATTTTTNGTAAPEPDKSGLVGLTITAVRPMLAAELRREGWEANLRHGVPACLVLSDGSKLYASRDDEGNGPGILFGTGKAGTFRVG